MGTGLLKYLEGSRGRRKIPIDKHGARQALHCPFAIVVSSGTSISVTHEPGMQTKEIDLMFLYQAK